MSLIELAIKTLRAQPNHNEQVSRINAGNLMEQVQSKNYLDDLKKFKILADQLYYLNHLGDYHQREGLDPPAYPLYFKELGISITQGFNRIVLGKSLNNLRPFCKNIPPSIKKLENNELPTEEEMKKDGTKEQVIEYLIEWNNINYLKTFQEFIRNNMKYSYQAITFENDNDNTEAFKVIVNTESDGFNEEIIFKWMKISIAHGSTKIINFLIDKSNKNMQSVIGESLKYSCGWVDEKPLKILLNRITEYNINHKEVINDAIEHTCSLVERINSLKVILEYDINFIETIIKGLLNYLFDEEEEKEKDTIEIIEFAISLKKPINFCNIAKEAIRNHNISLLKIIIRYVSDIDELVNYYMQLSINYHNEIIEILTRNGGVNLRLAYVNIRDSNAFGPVEREKRRKNLGDFIFDNGEFNEAIKKFKK